VGQGELGATANEYPRPLKIDKRGEGKGVGPTDGNLPVGDLDGWVEGLNIMRSDRVGCDQSGTDPRWTSGGWGTPC
jgi:hypothetical protein